MRLSLSQVLSESFGFFFANTRLFFHLVTIPWIMSIVIRIVGGLVSRIADRGHGREGRRCRADDDVHGRLAAARAAGTAPHRRAAGPRLVVARDGLARASAQGGRHDLRADGHLHDHGRPDGSARPSGRRRHRSGHRPAIRPGRSARPGLHRVAAAGAARELWPRGHRRRRPLLAALFLGAQPGQCLADHRRPVRRLFRRRLRHRRGRAADPRHHARRAAGRRGRRGGELDGGHPGGLRRDRDHRDGAGGHLPPPVRLARRRRAAGTRRTHRRSRSSPISGRSAGGIG